MYSTKLEFIAQDEIQKGDNVTFENDKVHKTKQGEDVHYVSGHYLKPSDTLIFTVSEGELPPFEPSYLLGFLPH